MAKSIKLKLEGAAAIAADLLTFSVIVAIFIGLALLGLVLKVWIYGTIYGWLFG